jgi:hypothetical protein
MTDPVVARQAAKAAERERLTRARERRENQGSSGVSGFVRRKWRWLGVGDSESIEAVLAMLTETVAAAGIPEVDRSWAWRRGGAACAIQMRSSTSAPTAAPSPKSTRGPVVSTLTRFLVRSRLVLHQTVSWRSVDAGNRLGSHH